MAEEFQAAWICGGNWLMNSSKSMLMGDASPCSMGINDDLGAYGSYWMADMVDLKPRSTCKDNYNHITTHIDTINPRSSPGDHRFMVLQSPQKAHQQVDSESGGSTILMDSNFLMMGFNFSSSSSSSSPDWTQALLRSGSSITGRAETCNSIIQEDMNLGLNPSLEIQKDWSGDPKSFACGGEEDPSVSSFKAMNQDFSLEQQRLNPLNTSDNTPTASSQGFTMGPATFGYPSPLVQRLFEPDPQSSLFNNRPMNYYGTNQQQATGLLFDNNTPFSNDSTNSFDDIRANILSSSQPLLVGSALEEKPNCNNLPTKINHAEVQNFGSIVKKGCEPVFKRPRIETPSPLPTFKVRKEKLGDRVTALQQLVSPFGKTDTASVLHEAIEYIKFLHDQVNVLSTPYMKNGNPFKHHQATEVLKDSEGANQDLRSRGLCLVPISSTFPVASETTSDIWTPTFGGTFR